MTSMTVSATGREDVAPPGFRALRMGELDRFLVPLEDDDILRWFLKHLFVAHNLRERVAGLVAAGSGARWARRALFSRCWTLEPAIPDADGGTAQVDEGWAHELARIGATLAQTGSTVVDTPDPARCIFVRDYTGSLRGHLLVFAFPLGSDRPGVVVKIGPAEAPGGTLRTEWEALRLLDRRLPAELRDRVPRPLAFDRTTDLEVLVVSGLCGRSAYIDLYQGLDPGRHVAVHFAAALDWLVRFHTATRVPGRVYRPDRDPVLRAWLAARHGRTLPWYDRLLELCARAPVPLAAGHGDFWARNLLLPREAGSDAAQPPAAAVVDWERFSPEAPPFDDLFHFALTYGLNYPWSRYRRRCPLEAFRLTFLADNAVSREVRRFLNGYCERTGLDPALLLPLACVHLLARAQRADRDDSVWLKCQRLLERAPRSVLEP